MLSQDFDQNSLFDVSLGATAEFGVGKNMVQAINYWSIATDIICKKDKNTYGLTDLGKNILHFDPYLENINTIWLLHIHLVSNNLNSTINWLFNYVNESTFTQTKIIDSLYSFWNDKKNTKLETIKRDVITILNTYSPKNKNNVFNEDYLESPFSSLNLIYYSKEHDYYRKIRRIRNNLNNEIILYSLMHYWEKYLEFSSTLMYSKSCFDTGSPGNVLQIHQNKLEEIGDFVENYTNNNILLRTSSGGHTDWLSKFSIEEFKDYKYNLMLNCLKKK